MSNLCKNVSKFAQNLQRESDTKNNIETTYDFRKININKVLNYNEKDQKKRSKREIAPARVSKYGRSTTVAPVPKSAFSIEVNSFNPPTVTSIDAD
jgi:hypothetical protein